jgi:hypothetical protein
LVGQLEAHRAEIDRTFDQDSVEAIVAALQREKSAWADKVLHTLSLKPPKSLKATHYALRHSSSLTLEQALALEFRGVMTLLQEPDFVEGVRAVIIDKDNTPKWRHSSMQSVSSSEVAQCFEHHAAFEWRAPNWRHTDNERLL